LASEISSSYPLFNRSGRPDGVTSYHRWLYAGAESATSFALSQADCSRIIG
jgi:hypothetical protein